MAGSIVGMAVSRKYKCPECTRVFPFLHHPNVESDPVRACPHCGWAPERDGGVAEVEVAAPHVQNYAAANGADFAYRAMEESSAHHVEMAAAMAGCDRSEMESLKITDLKDNLEYGEIAVRPVENSVTQAMAQIPAAAGMGMGAGGAPQAAAQFAAAAHTGKDAFAGLRTMSSVIRPAHAQLGGGALSNDIVPLEIANRTIAPHMQRVPGTPRRAGRR